MRKIPLRKRKNIPNKVTFCKYLCQVHFYYNLFYRFIFEHTLFIVNPIVLLLTPIKKLYTKSDSQNINQV